jgi:ribosomal protein S27E
MNLEDLAKNPEKIKDLISLLSSLLPDNQAKDTEQDEEEVQEAMPIKSKKINTKKKRTNKFVLMPESGMHKDDCEIDKKLQKYPPTLRNRPANFVDVRCRVCGKTEQVRDSLVDSMDRYKCNNCARSPG